MESIRDYEEKRKTVNQMRRRAKRDMWNKIGEDLEDDYEGTKKLMYSMAKRYRGFTRDKVKAIKNPDGNVLVKK